MQKVWLGIFIAMFVVPEVLWGLTTGIPALNSKIKSNDDNHLLLMSATFIQFLGLFLSGIVFFRSGYKYGRIIGMLCMGLSLFPLYLSYLLYATLNFWS